MCFTPDGNAPSMCRTDSLKFFRSISLNSYRNGTHLNSRTALPPYGVETDKKQRVLNCLYLNKNELTTYSILPPGLNDLILFELWRYQNETLR